MVASYLSERHPVEGYGHPAERFPTTLPLVFDKVQELRYGENPHQHAAFYRSPAPRGASVSTATVLQGKDLSFNNIADADAAIECVRQFGEPACVIVKHANPCGVAVAASPLEAYDRAYRTDPTSAFGGIIAFNRELDVTTAAAIIDRQFVEVLAAPAVSADAAQALAAKPNVRVLVLGDLSRAPAGELEYRSVTGGLLIQTRDTGSVDAKDLKVVTRRKPTPAELADLLFAWRVCKFVKSNAIVFARDRSTIGVGAGQMSRVYSTRIAAMKAADERLEVEGSVMASDAFFPFRDGLDVAAEYGIRAVDPTGRLEERRRSHRGRGRARPRHGTHRHAPLPPLMKVLIIGSGGREHALAWKCAASARVTEVIVAPGNAGTATEPKVRNANVPAEDIPALIALALAEKVALTIIGPEGPLVAGIVDEFTARGLKCFGPTKAPSQLEGSKAFTKEFLRRHGIPTARSRTFTRETFDRAYVERQRPPIVVKASGLAAGKGVVIAESTAEALTTVEAMFAGRFGAAGEEVVIEEFLSGEEASFIVMADGTHIIPFATSQDHKRRDDGDRGPNTGGMGAYSPAPVVTPSVHDRIMREVIEPTIRGLAADGMPYTGFLYAGIMVAADGTPNVIEFNCRFGDPEAQPVLIRLKSDLTVLCEAAVDGRLHEVTAELGLLAPPSAWFSRRRDIPDTRCARATSSRASSSARAPGKVFQAGTRLEHGKVLTNGGRVLCAVGLGETVAAAQREAYALVEPIRWTGMQYRHDIGYRAVARQSGANAPTSPGRPAEFQQSAPHIVTLEVLAADIDAYDHVNNSVYLAWFDRAAWSHSETLGLSLDQCVTCGGGWQRTGRRSTT